MSAVLVGMEERLRIELLLLVDLTSKCGAAHPGQDG